MTSSSWRCRRGREFMVFGIAVKLRRFFSVTMESRGIGVTMGRTT